MRLLAPALLLFFSSAAIVHAEPLRLAVLGMPLDELEEEAEAPAPSPPSAAPAPKITPPPAPPAPPASPEPVTTPVVPEVVPTAPVAEEHGEGDGGDAPGATGDESPPSVAQTPAPPPGDMALFRVLSDRRHDFYPSTLALPVYGNQQRLDPDLCLTLAWNMDARWQSRLCYTALYGELEERDRNSGAMLGRFSTQWADGQLDLIDYVHATGDDFMISLGWVVSRYLLDFDRTGQFTELGGTRYDSQSTLVALTSGLQVGAYLRTAAGSVLRARVSLEPFGRYDLDQAFFVGNDLSASQRQGGSNIGTVVSLGLSATRRLAPRLEGTAEVRYRHLPYAYETLMTAQAGTDEIQLVDRFSGSDTLIRTGLRLGIDVPWASVSPYVETTLFYTSHKDEADKEYLYYSGYRFYLGVAKIF